MLIIGRRQFDLSPRCRLSRSDGPLASDATGHGVAHRRLRGDRTSGGPLTGAGPKGPLRATGAERDAIEAKVTTAGWAFVDDGLFTSLLR